MPKKTNNNNISTKKIIIFIIPIILFLMVVVFSLISLLTGIAGKKVYDKAQDLSSEQNTKYEDLPHGFPKDFEFYPKSIVVNSFFSKKDSQDIYTINLISEDTSNHSSQDLVKYYSDYFSKSSWIILEQSTYNTNYIEAQKDNTKVSIGARNSGDNNVTYSVVLVRLNQ